MNDCHFVGNFCYRCRWNKVRRFDNKPKYTGHYNVIGWRREEGMFCTLCGEEKSVAILLKTNNHTTPDSLCAKCADAISKEFEYSISNCKLRKVIVEAPLLIGRE